MGVRVASQADDAKIQALLAEAAESLSGRRGGAGLLETWLGSAGPESAHERLRGHLGAAVSQSWLTEDQDGLAVAWIGPDAGWLAVWVSDGARHRGEGAALAAAALRWLEGQGATIIDALALPGDRDMKNILERAGFKARLLTLRREG